MKIVDMNIVSKFCSGEIHVDFSESVYVTSELKDEIEIHKASFPGHRTKLQVIRTIDIEKYRYHNGEYFSEARYLAHYKNLINRYTNITSFYGLKGLGDMSILAAVATVLNPDNPSLFDGQKVIEVVTNDGDLKIALSQEFGNRVIINDPLTPN
jgi:hypothetical protein